MRLTQRRRHVRRPPDLTSLFDVLFIVVFVALIRAAAAEQARVPPTSEPAPVPAGPKSPGASEDLATLKQRALTEIVADVSRRDAIVVRVSRTGVLTKIEHGTRRLDLDLPLLEHHPDPAVRVTYLGDRSAELRVCRIVVTQLGLADLSQQLVIVTPDAPPAELQEALIGGLERDIAICLTDQRGVAMIVAPHDPG